MRPIGTEVRIRLEEYYLSLQNTHITGESGLNSGARALRFLGGCECDCGVMAFVDPVREPFDPLGDDSFWFMLMNVC